MIFLYLKTHNITKLKYLGMTTQDPYRYSGSGVYWKKHIKKYGSDIDTKILKECQTYDEITYFGKYYSDLWDIVNSTDFANLVPELGENSSGMKNKKHSKESKLKTKQSLLGHIVTEETREKISNSNKGNTPWNIGMKGEYSIFSDADRETRSLAYSGESNPFFGKSHSDEFKLVQKENQQRIVYCPHCDKSGAIRIMNRWHFDKCKLKYN
jgi:ribosomal protein L37AE/L43A